VSYSASHATRGGVVVGTYCRYLRRFGNWLPAGEYKFGVGCHEMERHQIEYRAKECISSKERSPADI
jgi:hypothetical protein